MIAEHSGHRARSLARWLTLQAHYQLQISTLPWPDIQAQFALDPEAGRVGLEFFIGLFAAIAPNREALDLQLSGLCEIPAHELDPVEYAVLWLGLLGIQSQPELPYCDALEAA